MNIYRSLNDITKYIEDHLEEDVSYVALARILGTNEYTMKRIFSLLTGIGLSEYIRKRRLSCAGFDLCGGKWKIIDLAVKYRYENATSFSRAFEHFHGVKPSEMDTDTALKNFPRIVFQEDVFIPTSMKYEIVSYPEFNLYGKGISTDNAHIAIDAPQFFYEFEKKYYDKYGSVPFGMITYDTEREESRCYYCLYDREAEGMERIYIPSSKWLKFQISSQNAKEIHDVSQQFYHEFLPSCKFNLRELPELEYYHDGVTDFLVAID